MNSAKAKYRSLFDLLLALGFTEEAVIGPPATRLFVHAPTDTILPFRRSHSDEITSADILSTEVHLQGKGIIDQPIESLLEAAPVRK